MEYFAKEYDVAVIGAGHAGIEAGLASARLGSKTIVFTINLDWIGNMPCKLPTKTRYSRVCSTAEKVRLFIRCARRLTAGSIQNI
mgnify:CR=1 FL=1